MFLSREAPEMFLNLTFDQREGEYLMTSFSLFLENLNSAHRHRMCQTPAGPFHSSLSNSSSLESPGE